MQTHMQLLLFLNSTSTKSASSYRMNDNLAMELKWTKDWAASLAIR